MWVPSGITDGSTATPQPTGSPVDFLPPSAYPVATTPERTACGDRLRPEDDVVRFAHRCGLGATTTLWAVPHARSRRRRRSRSASSDVGGRASRCRHPAARASARAQRRTPERHVLQRRVRFLSREVARRGCELGLCGLERNESSCAVPATRATAVEVRHRVLEVLRAHEDLDRLDISFLVQRPEPLRERTLRDHGAVTCDTDLELQHAARRLQRLRAQWRFWSWVFATASR